MCSWKERRKRARPSSSSESAGSESISCSKFMALLRAALRPARTPLA